MRDDGTMSASLNGILKIRLINGWKLFWLVTTSVSIAVMVELSRVDLASAEGVSSMIQLSVRCAIPWLYLAFAASAVNKVFPGPLGGWFLRNRKYLGLCFAAAMGWQLTFILWLVGIHTEYYVNDVYVLSDAVEGVVGYTLLIAMVLTSFKFGRSRLTPKQWRMLHTGGIYWLWFYAWSVYWFALFYYSATPILLDYLYYWGGLVAWSLRMTAWTKSRLRQSAVRSPA